ncbi:MAG: DUF5928 domain-containing protein [Pseudomonadota bacterium]
MLLVHKDAAAIVRQARLLASQGDAVVVHVDGGASADTWLGVVEGLAGVPGVHLLRNRVRCGWGHWSLVDASLRLARAGLAVFPDATHFYLVSGDCVPTKSARTIRRELHEDGRDRIEAVDFFTSGWIKTGLCEDRVSYRHWFNERVQRWLFYGSLAVQRWLGVTRKVPKGLRLRIGSQWWCLRRSTLQAVVDLACRHPKWMRFFRTTWIPDESFFQTMVGQVVPEAELTQAPPTFLMFSDYGLPICFHDDHADGLWSQPGFFARKLAGGAQGLRSQSEDVFKGPDRTAPPPENCFAKTLRWTASRGRVGRSTPPPPWSRPAPRITAIICKRWDLARQVESEASRLTGAAALGHVFDTLSDGDPDLGGYGYTLDWRREAPLRYLCRAVEAAGKSAVSVCLDPCRLDVVRALQDVADAHVLWLDIALDHNFAAAHADRLGLRGAMRDGVALELEHERHDLARLPPGSLARVSDQDPTPRITHQLASALDIDHGLAGQLAAQIQRNGP